MVHCLLSCFLFCLTDNIYDFFKVLYLGDFNGGGTPDSIPNSEVKSTCADGTFCFANGRVSSRQDIELFLYEKLF